MARPRTRPDGPFAYVGFRLPHELKRQLEAAAAANGRSIAVETQFRIQRSFVEDRIETALAEFRETIKGK